MQIHVKKLLIYLFVYILQFYLFTELAIDMAACQKKESELLEFTQKLTDTNVTLQSDLAFAEGR